VTAYVEAEHSILPGGTIMEWLVISAFSTVASMVVATTVLTLMAL
jgi:acyl-CoA hydrolase